MLANILQVVTIEASLKILICEWFKAAWFLEDSPENQDAKLSEDCPETLIFISYFWNLFF